MISTLPLISKSFSPFTNPLVNVPSVPITIAITVTFMFHSLFVVGFFFGGGVQFPSNAQVYIFLLAFFQFYSVASRDETIHNSLGSLSFFFFLSFSFFVVVVVVVDYHLVCSSERNPFVGQHPIGVYESHSPRQMQDCVYTICLYGQISISCTIPSGSLFLPSCV